MPVFLKIGGEHSLSHLPEWRRSDLFLFDLTKQYGAALLTLQHRYYGWNTTYSLNEPDALKWLTTEYDVLVICQV